MPSGPPSRTVPSASRTCVVRARTRSRTTAAGGGSDIAAHEAVIGARARSSSLRRMQNSLPSGSVSTTQPMPGP